MAPQRAAPGNQTTFAGLSPFRSTSWFSCAWTPCCDVSRLAGISPYSGSADHRTFCFSTEGYRVCASSSACSYSEWKYHTGWNHIRTRPQFHSGRNGHFDHRWTYRHDCQRLLPRATPAWNGWPGPGVPLSLATYSSNGTGPAYKNLSTRDERWNI